MAAVGMPLTDSVVASAELLASCELESNVDGSSEGASV